MLFAQTNAPTGWTKVTTHDNKALRVVSGAASSGGTRGFTAAFNTTFTSDGTTLTESQIPAHRHGMFDDYDNTQAYELGDYPAYSAAWGSNSGGDTEYSINSNLSLNANFGVSGETGGGQAHTHTMNFDVAYVDVIIATKN
jgi:microcystin-dependent protein